MTSYSHVHVYLFLVLLCDWHNNNYYQPASRGRHQLHIKVEGDHIKGSPFPVTVKLPVLTLRGVNRAIGVAFNKRSEIIVAERGEHCVSIFTSLESSHSDSEL